MFMSNQPIESMFRHQGKTVNIIGKNRTKIYQELYKDITELQANNELPVHDNYLGPCKYRSVSSRAAWSWANLASPIP